MNLIRNPLTGGFITDFQQSSRGCPNYSVFSSRSCTFCHFRTQSVLILSNFQQSARVCSKYGDFIPRSARFVISALSAPLFSVFSPIVSTSLLQMRVLIPRAESLVISFHFFAIISKLDEFVQNSELQPDIITFCHLRTGQTTCLKRFSAKCTSLYKTAFSTRDHNVLSFLHWAHV